MQASRNLPEHSSFGAVDARFCKVALDTPLRRLFDYRIHEQGSPVAAADVAPGKRVRVPFGRQKLVGVVVELADSSELAEEKLRTVIEVLDDGTAARRAAA